MEESNKHENKLAKISMADVRTATTPILSHALVSVLAELESRKEYELLCDCMSRGLRK